MSKSIAMLGCDGFLLALDHMMRRHGQGAHLSQTVIELDHAPDAQRLGRAWEGFINDHPIVVARRGRSRRNGLPIWRLLAHSEQSDARLLPPVGYWHEDQAGTDQPGSGQPTCLESFCRWRRDRGQGARANADGPSLQLDIFERTDGSAAAVMTWSHVLVDGKGVELIFAELAQRCRQPLHEPSPSLPTAGAGNTSQTKKPGSTVKEKIRRSRAFADHFANLQKTRFRSLGGAKPFGGPISCRVVTLDQETTQQVNERAQRLTSQLITTPFFLAAAAVAHGRVFAHRGMEPGPQIITLPVQIRPKGGAGPLFQNYVTILFFKLESEQLADVESATAEIRKQFAGMMRNRLDTSFTMMLDLMRWMPPAIYAGFLRRQMGGEITSFFHSYTGPFAPPTAGSSTERQNAGLTSTTLTDLAGAKVHNAWHIPVISTPPGTGLFLGQYAQRLSISMSWRDAAIDEAEQDLLLNSFLEALNGEPPGEANTRLWT